MKRMFKIRSFNFKIHYMDMLYLHMTLTFRPDTEPLCKTMNTHYSFR